MSENIGIVFIHGAGLGGFIWGQLKPLMHYPVLKIEFPNREGGEKSNSSLSFDDYIQPAIEQIQEWDDKKLVFVTHSIGGCLGLSLAERFSEKVVGFVGISAAIPKNGQSFISILPFPQRLILPLILSLFGTKPPKNAIELELGNDLTEAQKEVIVKRFTPESKSLYSTKIFYKKLDVKTLYIKLTLDKSIPMPLQDQMSANLNAIENATLETGHLPMISKPNELAEILNSFVNTIKG